MKISRQQQRKMLRFYGEVAVVALVGKGLPRKQRRAIGRIYGSAAYRLKENLPSEDQKYRPAVEVLGWIVKEATKRFEYVEPPLKEIE